MPFDVKEHNKTWERYMSDKTAEELAKAEAKDYRDMGDESTAQLIEQSVMVGVAWSREHEGRNLNRIMFEASEMIGYLKVAVIDDKNMQYLLDLAESIRAKCKDDKAPINPR